MNRAGQRQFIWKLLSLWAVLALSVPSLAWACPMNGNFARSSAPVCPCLQKAQSGDSAALDTSLHKCCKQLPLPSSDTSGDHKNGSPLIPKLTSAKLVGAPTVSPATHLPLYALPSVVQDSGLKLLAVSTPTLSPPRVLSQHFVRLNSGRSPPL